MTYRQLTTARITGMSWNWFGVGLLLAIASWMFLMPVFNEGGWRGWNDTGSVMGQFLSCLFLFLAGWPARKNLRNAELPPDQHRSAKTQTRTGISTRNQSRLAIALLMVALLTYAWMFYLARDELMPSIANIVLKVGTLIRVFGPPG